MPGTKREHPKEKTGLHPRNRHRERYDFKALTNSCPELCPFVVTNDYGDESIDFFDPAAVKMLNKALLKHFYDIVYWDIPKNYLCPPIPGRADYIHHIADLVYGSIPENMENVRPDGEKIRCLDIGVGANCIYPIIGHNEYGWSFIGTDIDPVAIESAQKIIDMNPSLHGVVELRLQSDPKEIFNGIIKKNELFDITICNPPFHSSFEDAQSVTIRKLRNLKQKKINKPTLNFGGQNNELWCEGGEEWFIKEMIHQSQQFSTTCHWFTTLVSREDNLAGYYKALGNINATEVKTILMSHGNKSSRLLAWTFFPKIRVV